MEEGGGIIVYTLWRLEVANNNTWKHLDLVTPTHMAAIQKKCIPIIYNVRILHIYIYIYNCSTCRKPEKFLCNRFPLPPTRLDEVRNFVCSYFITLYANKFFTYL